MNNILYDRMSKTLRHAVDSFMGVYRDGSALELCKCRLREIMEKMAELEKPVALDAVYEEAAESHED